MIEDHRRKLILEVTVIALALVAAATAAEPLPRSITYEHRRIESGPHSIYIASIDRSDPNLKFASTLATGTVYGLATVPDQIATLPVEAGRPVLAVNADFFTIRPGPYQGDPTGLHIAAGEITSSPIGSSFWIDPQGAPHIGEVYPRFRATCAEGLDIPFTLNQSRADDKAVLYTPSVGPSTRTRGGIELVLERADEGPWLPLQPSKKYTARLAGIFEPADRAEKPAASDQPTAKQLAARIRETLGSGGAPLEPDTMVLSIGPKLLETITLPEIGTRITLSTATSPDLQAVRTAIGGGVILIADGKVRQWSPPQPRHPRTVIGFNKTHIYIAVIDGRRPGRHIGMTYPQLAELMKGLGCTCAMNLDGGGSSTFWLNGRILNTPSDGKPRAVANALILLDTGTTQTKN